MKRLTTFPDSSVSGGLALAVFVGLAGGSALAQPSFDGAANYFVGTEPSGVAAGDFDGDGDVDLATTVDGPDRVQILVNNGDGTYSPGGSTLLPNSSSPQDLIAGRLDGDADIDLAVAVRDPVGAVLILLNSGAGTFTLSGTVPVGERPRGLAIGDHDGDGDMDLAVANRDSNSASVLTNTGPAIFTAATLAIGGETRATAFGNFDGDGDLDLAVTNHDNRSVHTFANSGGVFTAGPVLSLGPFVRPDGLTSADLDNDGDGDLAVAVSDDTLGIEQAVVFLATGGGAFGAGTGFNTGGTNTSGIVAADFDCNGLMDLATSNQDSNNVSILLNAGGGSFGGPTLLAAGLNPDEITTADLDQDGDADLATANRNSNNVSVFINDTCEPVNPCPWDLDADGAVDVDDLVSVILAWGPNPGHPADFDGDGGVDVDDLVAVILNWGMCP